MIINLLLIHSINNALYGSEDDALFVDNEGDLEENTDNLEVNADNQVDKDKNYTDNNYTILKITSVFLQ